jgi:hypothetical protein
MGIGDLLVINGGWLAILGFVDNYIGKLRFVNKWIWHIKSLRGGGFGASNSGDVVMMTIHFFSF